MFVNSNGVPGSWVWSQVLASGGKLVVGVPAGIECGDAAGVGSDPLGRLGEDDAGVLALAAQPGGLRG